MTDQRDGPIFDVVPFPPTATKRDCLFLVTNRDTGTHYEIAVTRDAMGFYEMVVNGSERYDVENAPDYVTFPILDKAAEMYAKADAEEEAAKRLNDRVDATLGALAMQSDSDRKRIH